MNAVLLAAALAVQAAPAQADDVVTVKRKTTVWTFARLPEARVKLKNPQGREAEYDVPPRLAVAWSSLEEESLSSSSGPFMIEKVPPSFEIPLFQPGKTYGPEQYPAPEDQAGYVRDVLADVLQALLHRYLEFDLDFPGGGWEDLARMLREKLVAAYAQQTPALLQRLLPEAIDLVISTPPDYRVRYPALQARAATLYQLHAFGLRPLLQERREETGKVVKTEDGSLVLSTTDARSLAKWTLLDGWRSLGAAPDMEIAFFNLAGLAKAEDVVALFELAWKSRGGPIFARVKFHPETKTLLLQATLGEIQAAKEAFASLTGRPAAVPPPTANPFESIQAVLERIAQQVEKHAADKKDK